MEKIRRIQQKKLKVDDEPIYKKPPKATTQELFEEEIIMSTNENDPTNKDDTYINDVDDWGFVGGMDDEVVEDDGLEEVKAGESGLPGLGVDSLEEDFYESFDVSRRMGSSGETGESYLAVPGHLWVLVIPLVAQQEGE